ncbi:putative acyl-coenzyme A synthetase [Lachnellula suecica]|uniref:Putative acyl-coenzyme A synthetase n=1 Tax=Lachnellula suecica TaxID=602035 RepID=A0A8T9CDQ4_9HELO|nr:putative acyl-coenzyme A synthetase [Lachnellula suecica]
MVYQARTDYPVPDLDLLSLLFDSDTCQAKEETQIHIDAADPSNAINKSEARSMLQRIAHGLRSEFSVGASGSGKDVVVCISSGQPMLPIFFFGVIAAGGVFSAASTAFKAPELANQIQLGGSNLLVCSTDTKDVALLAAVQCGLSPSRVLVLDSNPWTLTPIEEGVSCISEQKLDWRRITNRKELTSSLICLVYSSGTTGVLLSHANMVASAVLSGSLSVDRSKPPFEYRTLAHLPAAHIAGVQGYLVNPFFMGGSVYWMRVFSWPEFLEYNRRYRITYIFSVPPIFLLVAKSPLVKDHFDSLEIAISGAAPLGKELQAAASSKLRNGKTFITQTWGLSETTSSITLMPWGEKDDTGSVSPLLPSIEMRIVDDNFVDMEPGQPGEALVRGPIVTNGYHKNVEANAEVFKDGWFCTGEVAVVRANGKIYIVDRKKELIKYKGLQIAPAELEALLLSHSKIKDAAVIGVLDESAGTEVPRAYCVTEGGISEEEIKGFVNERVAGHKQLRGGVVFLQAIPKSAAGKILRKDLRQLAQRQLRAKL